MTHEQVSPPQDENQLIAERRDKLKNLRETGIGWGRHICSYVFGQLCLSGLRTHHKVGNPQRGLGNFISTILKQGM